ncbi:[weak similarity to] P26s4 [Bathymodiolus azoricus thioautotrophic gill symbiont]|uniref:[weak similarity to] P26s4, partial n=1 Tax=Bathymodiolus azoricus thioautotrophic gill symbiont TaxID=235205 RepID=A0A1H6M853_9GAMM|nr:[weak similarity to] P26s4 [Bathymodiolus azoricus thioautotrophic gill symbiont]
MTHYFNIFCILGKTLLAKAVANQTSATFLRVVGSELIQKYLVSLKRYH